jgi:hypothetical protein
MAGPGKAVKVADYTACIPGIAATAVAAAAATRISRRGPLLIS